MERGRLAVGCRNRLTVRGDHVRGDDAEPLEQEDLELLALVARGLPTVAVARRLRVSERTVRRRLQVTVRAFGVGTPIEAVVTAVRRGLI